MFHNSLLMHPNFPCGIPWVIRWSNPSAVSQFASNAPKPKIFSSAVFGENGRYIYCLGGVSVGQKFWHFLISLLLLKVFTWNSEYVFTIQIAIHTFKRDNSEYIFLELCPFFDFDFLSSIKHPNSRAMAHRAFSSFPLCLLSYLTEIPSFEALMSSIMFFWYGRG